MKQLVQILKPLKEATWELSAEQIISCSKAIPLPNAILFKLWKYVVDESETQVCDDGNETQVPVNQRRSDPPRSEEAQKVVAGLITSIEQRWLRYEEDRIYSTCTLLDPRFKEVCFTSFALVRAKRLLLNIMHANPVCSSESAVIDSEGEAEDDQEGAPVKRKKCLWDSFDEELKKKKSAQLSSVQDKNEQEFSLYCNA